jgi:NO-binding membrane sensor protein with MHYT domain
MRSSSADSETKLETLKLMLYLVPIFGFFPALWSLYFQQGSVREKSVSKTAVTLALLWVLLYGLTAVGAQGTDLMSTRLLVGSLLATTGYFMTNLWLMVRLMRGGSTRLPGISRLSDRLP